MPNIVYVGDGYIFHGPRPTKVDSDSFFCDQNNRNRPVQNALLFRKYLYPRIDEFQNLTSQLRAKLDEHDLQNAHQMK